MSELIKGLYEIDLPPEVEIRTEEDITSLRLFFELHSVDCPYGWLPLVIIEPDYGK